MALRRTSSASDVNVDVDVDVDVVTDVIVLASTKRPARFLFLG